MDNHRIKATEIVIESLKLYIALSTLLLGGVLSLLGGGFSSTKNWAGYVGLIFFLLSIIFGIAAVNSLINKIYRDENDAIRKTDSRLLNFASIVFLILGLIVAGVYIQARHSTNKSLSKTNQIIIEENKISIPESCDKEIKIEKDSINFRITVN